jgi:hypothetical protein
MPAITQPTHNQSPVQVEDDSHSAESYVYKFQRTPDVVVTGFGVSTIRYATVHTLRQTNDTSHTNQT